MVRLREPGRRLALALTFVSLVGLSGCVERRYTIRSNPPGALAIVNGEEVGPTPVSKSFTFYGDREVTLMLDGHETQTIIQPIKAPWWDNYLTEFFTENMVPYTFRDERDYTYQLQPTVIPSQEELIGRGQDLRNQSQTNPPPRRGGILGYFGF
ncbi:PEGA domain-containing protein [Singulisphaera rosea]